MDPRKPSFSRSLLTIIFSSALLISSAAFSADPPKPKPRPGTLGAYARKITLDRSLLGDSAGHLVLTNDTVSGIAEGATITLGAVVTVAPKSSKASSRGGSTDRARWRAVHQKQHKVIADLQQRRSVLEIEISHLKKQQLTPKILARLDRTAAKRRHVEREISRAREELARIVRDARRQGAEPGWFR
jgi:hypothetical protein